MKNIQDKLTELVEKLLLNQCDSFEKLIEYLKTFTNWLQQPQIDKCGENIWKATQTIILTNRYPGEFKNDSSKVLISNYLLNLLKNATSN